MSTLHYLNQHWAHADVTPHDKLYDPASDKAYVPYTELSLHHLPTPSELQHQQLQSGYTTDDSAHSHDEASTPSSTCSSDDVMRTGFESWKLSDSQAVQQMCYTKPQHLQLQTEDDSSLESPASVELNDHQVQSMLYDHQIYEPYAQQQCLPTHSSGHRRLSSPSSFIFSAEDIVESNSAAAQYKEPKHYTTYPMAPVQLSLPNAVRQRLQKRSYDDVDDSAILARHQLQWSKSDEVRYQPEKYMVRDDHTRHTAQASHSAGVQYEAVTASLPAASRTISSSTTLPALVNTFHYTSRQHHRAQSANTQQPRHPLHTLHNRAQTAHTYQPPHYTANPPTQYHPSTYAQQPQVHQRTGLTRSQPLQGLNQRMLGANYLPHPPSHHQQPQRSTVTVRRSIQSTRLHPMQ